MVDKTWAWRLDLPRIQRCKYTAREQFAALEMTEPVYTLSLLWQYKDGRMWTRVYIDPEYRIRLELEQNDAGVTHFTRLIEYDSDGNKTHDVRDGAIVTGEYMAVIM